MSSVIIGFVLAIVVPSVVAIGWLTLVTAQRTSQLSSRCQDLSERVSALQRGSEQTSNAALAVEVAALDGAVEKLAKHCRQQFGKVWAELHHEGLLDRNRKSQADIERAPTRDELRSQLLPRTIGTVPRPRTNGHDTEEGA